MKLSLRSLLIGSLGAAALGLSPLAVSPARAIYPEVTLGAERVQVIHEPGYKSDVTNFNITFTNHDGADDCDGGLTDAIASGIDVALSPYSCEPVCDVQSECVDAPIPSFPFEYFIGPFAAHTVNHQEYGTFYGLNPVDTGPGTVSGRIVLLSTSAYSCGTWNLNVEATGLNLSRIQHNPMSIWLNPADDSGPFCFDIDNAIIGGPTITPRPMVRRGVRR